MDLVCSEAGGTRCETAQGRPACEEELRLDSITPTAPAVPVVTTAFQMTRPRSSGTTCSEVSVAGRAALRGPWSPIALIIPGEAPWASDHPGLGSLKSQRERPGLLAPGADGPSQEHVAGARLSPQS